MTRYEFEVLSHLERNGAGQYSLRTLSDTLTISGGEISRCLEQLAAKHWITQDGDTLAVTDAGLAALEPYRVKNAIILAAGFGSRMMPATADRPKPLVTVNGVRILETLLDALVAVGIRDITVVRGYRRECFDALLEKYPFLTLVDNDIYSKTNNISSVMAGLNKLDGCYLCEADLYITNPQIITKYQYASNILGAYSLETDDWSFQMDGQPVTSSTTRRETPSATTTTAFPTGRKRTVPACGRTSGRSTGKPAGKTISGNSSLWCSGRSAMPWKFASAGSRTSWRSTITTNLRSWIPPTERRRRYEMLRRPYPDGQSE